MAMKNKAAAVDRYSLVYNTMAMIAMKDRKTVRIAEKPPPPPPPPWGGCGVAGLGWCVSIMAVSYYSLSQSVRKPSRNFRFSIYGRDSAEGIWGFVASGSFARCVKKAEFLSHVGHLGGSFTSNLHVVGLVTRTLLIG